MRLRERPYWFREPHSDTFMAYKACEKAHAKVGVRTPTCRMRRITSACYQISEVSENIQHRQPSRRGLSQQFLHRD